MKLAIALTTDLAICQKLRHRVFVQEQGVPVELEQDGQDAEAMHLLAVSDGNPVGTARVLTKDATAKIGRVCVLAEARGGGIGAALIEAALDELRRQTGINRAVLSAQVDAIRFYEKLGFVAYGEEFQDAGIAHRMMGRGV